MPPVGTIPRLFAGMEYIALVLEAILAELRFVRGMKDRETQFLLEGTADQNLFLDEFQEKRRALFPRS